MHGFVLDVVMDTDHETAEHLATSIAKIIAQHHRVRTIGITVRCDADPTAIEPSILDD